MKHIIVAAVLLGACSDVILDHELEVDEVAATLEVTTDVCAGVDLASDPNNCGACGNVCASGLCYWGVCPDDRAGHVFAIGHSYRGSNPALDRVLGNAIFLRESQSVKVLLYRGTAEYELIAAASQAVARATKLMRRSTTKTFVRSSAAIQPMLPDYEVLVIAAQPHETDAALAALAAEWSLPLDDFTRRGGIVVVLDAPSTTNSGTARVLGDLLPLTRVTNAPGAIAHVDAHDTIAAGGVPVMFALGDSVGYAPSGHADAVIGEAGHVVVAHRAVY